MLTHLLGAVLLAFLAGQNWDTILSRVGTAGFSPAFLQKPLGYRPGQQPSGFFPDDWVLETRTFLPNHYQTAPYVSNGYFGQSLPSEGVGYWIERDENGNYAKNCTRVPNLCKAAVRSLMTTCQPGPWTNHEPPLAP